jgi:hypothetical protein
VGAHVTLQATAHVARKHRGEMRVWADQLHRSAHAGEALSCAR